MSLSHEEYTVVDMLTLLAFNATAAANNMLNGGDDADGDGVVNREHTFAVVTLSNQSGLISDSSNSMSPSSTIIATTNPFGGFVTSSTATATAAMAANLTTTPTATAIASNKIRFNADIWLIPCYSLILLFAVVGNVLVITTLVQNRRMRTITNVFLLNLAISDILLGVLCMPVTLVGTLLRHFIFGEVLCKLFQFSQAASVAVSSWTLVAISCERYYAICHPLRSRSWQTLSHAYKIIAFIWIGSVVCMMPIALFSQLMPTSRQGMRKCREQWPREALAYERSYNIFLDLVLLILPLMVLCTAYILITRTLYVSMQNERAINFGNSPAIASTKFQHNTAMQPPLAATSNEHHHHHHQQQQQNQHQTNTSNFSLTFRWNYRPACASTSTASSSSTSSGRADCCRMGEELLPSHGSCAKQQQQQFYYYDDLSSRSVGFGGGIAHKRKQLTTPQNRQQQQQRQHLYSVRRSVSIKSLNRCSSDNCYLRGPHDEHFVGNGKYNGCGGGGSGPGVGPNICHLTTTAATAAASATTASSLASATTSPITTTTMTNIHHNNNQTMIVTNLTAQQPQRYKLYAQRQQAAILDGERYKMVTTNSPGLRMMDTTLRRTNTTKNLESKRRVVKMMFVLVLEFFICWTPLYVINTVAMFIGPAIYEYVDYTSISFFQLLAYSSSCCNPITYCFMNASFRRAFLDTFRGGLQWRRGRFKRHRRSKTETSLSAAGNSITLANSSATMMTTNTLLDSPRL